jgi:thiol-disulfide isomerase/thioredoxin
MKKVVLILFLLVASISLAQVKIIKFKADLKNMDSNTIVIMGAKGYTKEFKGDNKGHFEGDLEVKEGFYGLNIGEDYTFFMYLKEGDNLGVYADMKNFDETITFSGTRAGENNFMGQWDAQAVKMDSFQDSMKGLDNAAFNKAYAEIQNTNKALIEKMYNSKFEPYFIKRIQEEISQKEQEINEDHADDVAKMKLNKTISATFDYKNHAGGKTKLEDFKGKYVFIDIWATWCKPCLEQIPAMKKIEEKYRKKNIVFVGISVDDAKDFEKWKNFVNEKKLGGIQLFADKGFESDFIKTYVVNGIPRFILIDPQGKIINPEAEWPSKPKLQEELDKLLL